MNHRPLPTGPYAVGTATYTVYTDRAELRAPGTRRCVPVRVYYPADKAAVAGRKKARYMSRNVAQGLKKALHVPIPYDKQEAAGNNVSECYPDAPRIEGTRFPPVVFNHGLSSYRESNSFLCLELVSQGLPGIFHGVQSVLLPFGDAAEDELSVLALQLVELVCQLPVRAL